MQATKEVSFVNNIYMWKLVLLGFVSIVNVYTIMRYINLRNLYDHGSNCCIVLGTVFVNHNLGKPWYLVI